MYNYKIKTSFVSPKMPKARANKTSFISFYEDILQARDNTMDDKEG